MRQYNPEKLTFALLLLIFLVPSEFAIDIYTPSMPSMVSALNTTVTAVQWSMIIFMFALAIAELVAGTLSDILGRRLFLLSGMILLLIGSLICILSVNIWMLLIGRFIQGFAGATQVMVPSMTSDYYRHHPQKMSTISGYASIVWALVPILAPYLGGWLQHFFDWQANFIAIMIYASIALTIAYYYIPETYPKAKRRKITLKERGKTVLTLLRNKQFSVLVMIMTMMWGVMILFNVMTPFLFQMHLGVSAAYYGFLALIFGLAYFIGSLINMRLIKFLKPKTMIYLGLSVSLIAAIALLLTGLANMISLSWILPPLLICVAATALVFPNCWAGVVNTFKPEYAGLGSALMSSLIIAGNALISTLGSLTKLNTQIPLASLYIIMIAICLIGIYYTTIAENPHE